MMINKGFISRLINTLTELINGVYRIGRSAECTSSVLEALVLFKELYPPYRAKQIEKCIKDGAMFIEQIEKCIKDGAMFIENKQRKDGSW
jgi:achilleol B synthase